jgi:FkbH-like protein
MDEGRPPGPPTIAKCVVWDLDGTLWDGTLGEDAQVLPCAAAFASVLELDRRGLLQSIASRAPSGLALAQLGDLGLADYFLYPQFGTPSKSQAIAAIADALGIGIDSLVLVDDDPFERAEVAHTLPQVRCLEAALRGRLTEQPEFDFPRSESAGQRRRWYQNEQRRRAAEAAHPGPPAEFLAGLDLRLRIRRAHPAELARAEELTLRTHQLNSTGEPYSAAELAERGDRADSRVLLAELRDRFGDHGDIGLLLVDVGADLWHLRLLLTSCRVLSRGVGGVLLSWLAQRAQAAGVRLECDFRDTGKNRAMRIAYGFAGMRPLREEAGMSVYAAPGAPAPVPAWFAIDDEAAW